MKYITILLLFTAISSFSQNRPPYHGNNPTKYIASTNREKELLEDTLVVVLNDGHKELNEQLQKSFKLHWVLTPFKFVNQADIEKYKKKKDYSYFFYGVNSFTEPSHLVYAGNTFGYGYVISLSKMSEKSDDIINGALVCGDYKLYKGSQSTTNMYGLDTLVKLIIDNRKLETEQRKDIRNEIKTLSIPYTSIYIKNVQTIIQNNINNKPPASTNMGDMGLGWFKLLQQHLPIYYYSGETEMKSNTLLISKDLGLDENGINAISTKCGVAKGKIKIVTSEELANTFDSKSTSHLYIFSWADYDNRKLHVYNHEGNYVAIIPSF